MNENEKKLCRTWDALDQAIGRILTAQPEQMSGAAAQLEVQMKFMRAAMFELFTQHDKTPE